MVFIEDIILSGIFFKGYDEGVVKFIFMWLNEFSY